MARGILSYEDFILGDIILGDIATGDFVLRGILSGRILPEGILPWAFCPGGVCPDTGLNISRLIKLDVEQISVLDFLYNRFFEKAHIYCGRQYNSKAYLMNTKCCSTLLPPKTSLTRSWHKTQLLPDNVRLLLPVSKEKMLYPSARASAYISTPGISTCLNLELTVTELTNSGRRKYLRARVRELTFNC